MAASGMGEGASRIVSEMSMYRDQLLAQRESIEAQLVSIDGAISAMGGSGGSGISGGGYGGGRSGRGPGRPRGTGRRGRPRGSGGRAGSLQPMMVQVLRQRGGAMTPQEIADAVVRAGYKTKSASLVKAVSNALPKTREIKRVGRGQYSA